MGGGPAHRRNGPVVTTPSTPSTPSERLERTIRSHYARRPEIAAALGAYKAALKQHRTLPDRLVELVRLRVAFHNQCRSCMAIRYRDGVEAGVDENLVCSLERPAQASDLDEAERVALEYADRFATDHLSIDDAIHERLREHFDGGAIVELGILVATFVGFGRLSATWHMVEDLPARFLANGAPVTPWGGDEFLVME